MLETVSSRRLYGFLVLTVLPASFAIGYFLKDRKDSQVSLATATTPAEAPVVAIEERIRMLRRKDAELEREEKDVREKLRRVRVREEGQQAG